MEIKKKVAEEIKSTFHNIGDLLKNLHKLPPAEEESRNIFEIKKSVSFKSKEDEPVILHKIRK